MDLGILNYITSCECISKSFSAVVYLITFIAIDSILPFVYKQNNLGNTIKRFVSVAAFRERGKWNRMGEKTAFKKLLLSCAFSTFSIKG